MKKLVFDLANEKDRHAIRFLHHNHFFEEVYLGNINTRNHTKKIQADNLNQNSRGWNDSTDEFYDIIYNSGERFITVFNKYSKSYKTDYYYTEILKRTKSSNILNFMKKIKRNYNNYKFEISQDSIYAPNIRPVNYFHGIICDVNYSF